MQLPISTRGKYFNLRQMGDSLAMDLSQQRQALAGLEHEPAQQRCSSSPKAGIVNHSRYAVATREHTCPLTATMSYVTDMETDGLVRIYDKVVAPREASFCIAREALEGRTPEQLREHFSLAFLPTFVCDARVPHGGTITACSLVDGKGKLARIFLPETLPELTNERPLS